MSPSEPSFLYSGEGNQAAGRGLRVPDFQIVGALDDPRHYIAGPALRDAVNVALHLGMPLLLAGEPGVGKSQLAASVSWELGFGQPLTFHSKTDSAARDLFYRYDAIRHFHDIQARKENVQVQDYISYQALGVAVMRSLGTESEPGCRSVVLIDEIDKAPRDFPNDILNETESYSFAIPETGQTYKAESRHRPILFFTSNSEKNLPDAFLRRCLYFHIPFPDPDRLRQILIARLPESHRLSGSAFDRALEHFLEIRQFSLRKKPSTAECIAWMMILKHLQIDLDSPQRGDYEALALSYAALAKNAEDLAFLKSHLEGR